MTRTLPIIALAGALAAGGGWILTPPGDPLPGAAQAQEVADIDVSTVPEMVLGDADAPVEVIEYASYTCPHCASFHGDQYGQIKENYIDTGDVRFVYREIYFDRFGLWASMIARCGDQERFFGITETLYEEQSEWLAGGDPAQIAENLRRIGIAAGLDAEEVDACMADGEQAQTLVAWFEQNAEADGITGTPSFLIDGEKYSNMSYADFAEILDERLAD